MIRFKGLDLFSSGPSRLEPGPIESRDAIGDAPGSVGASVIGQGLAPRALVQRGTLAADSLAALRSLIEGIQAEVGAGAATLIDGDGKAWPGCVMRRFDPGVSYRLGPRVATDYTVTYLQTTP